MIDNELHPLTDALRRVGAEAPPVRLPGDLWRRGRQRRRRRIAGSVVAATAAVLALLVALPLGLRPGGGGTGYCAFVVRRKGPVTCVPLGAAAAIDAGRRLRFIGVRPRPATGRGRARRPGGRDLDS